MMRACGALGARLVLACCCVSFLGAADTTTPPAKPPSPLSSNVVAGTTWIQTIVRDITQETVRPLTLIPAAMCPGHYDLKPSDIRTVAGCRLLLIHDWQESMPNVSGLVRAARLPAERIRAVSVDGNWMVPETQIRALESIERILEKIAPDRAAAYRERVQQRSREVQEFVERIQERIEASSVRGRAVLCHVMQAPLARWAGFSVADTFDRSEDHSVATMNRLVEKGRSTGACLVIDNLQSGDPHTGEALARALGAPRVVLTNFPGGLDGTGTWEEALEMNVGLLLDAVAGLDTSRE